MHKQRQKLQRSSESKIVYGLHMGLKNKHISRDIVNEDFVTPASVSKFTGKGK
jgi:hypothetical protein